MAKKQEPKSLLYRNYSVENPATSVRKLDDGSVVVELSVSSEAPYPRMDRNGNEFLEVLSHRDGAIDTSRVDNAAPVLWNHNTDQQCGVVERFYTEDGQGRAVVRFSKNSELGRSIGGDVADGIIRNVSIGYGVNRWDNPKTRKTDSDGTEIRTATSYTIYEISMVSVPADNTVGVGRSAEEVEATTPDDERALQFTTSQVIEQATESTTSYMDDGSTVCNDKVSSNVTTVYSAVEIPDVEVEGSPAEEATETAAEEAAEDEVERKETHASESRENPNLLISDSVRADAPQTHIGVSRMNELSKFRSFAKANGYSESNVSEWLAAGRSLKDVADEHYSRAEEKPVNAPELSRKEVTELTSVRSFDGAIEALITGRPVDGLANEIGMDAARKAGLPMQDRAFYMPTNVPLYKRSTMATDDAAGGTNYVANQYVTFEQALYENTIAGKLGVEIVTGATAILKMPRLLSGSVVSYSGETGSVSEAGHVTEMLTWQPNEILAAVPWSRTLGVMNSSYDVESTARRDMAIALASAFDSQIFVGPGGANRVLGLVNDSAIPLASSGSSGAFAYSRALAAWELVRELGHTNDQINFVISPKAFTTGASTALFSGAVVPIIQNGQIGALGPVINSTYVGNQPASGKHAILAGSFQAVKAVQFGALILMKDEYTAAGNNTVKLRGFLYMDSHARQPLQLSRDVDCTG